MTTMSEAADRADALVVSLNLADAPSPVELLQRMFSCTALSSVQRERLSPTSPSIQPNSASVSSLVTYKQIGKGYCGVVFEIPGEDLVWKKRIGSKELETNIWRDYRTLTHVSEDFCLAEIILARALGEVDLPRIPIPEGFLDKDDEDSEQWNEVLPYLPSQDQYRSGMFKMQRVLPLPQPVREALIDVFCPEKGREGAKNSKGNKDCIARLYLGASRSNNSQSRQHFFSLSNFAIRLDMARQICPAEIYRLAQEMAYALAVFHWHCELDANDVEFVLGSLPNVSNFRMTAAAVALLDRPQTTLPEIRYKNSLKRAVHLWVIDYDKCNSMTMSEEGVKAAAKAAEDNDPYFPKPNFTQGTFEADLWRFFAEAYITASGVLIKPEHKNTARSLASTFCSRVG